ncbi:acyl-CoA ligase (AMP-forming), exosortase A system-associated [Parasphingorhabdus sp.]|uniref:acyl-CoA ligase (AMP-forming), exosortase A system-associated n=1 Tax=Parasphingorhabdus sp. TaxID=2709688 RepID=UPI003D2C6026
MNIEAQNAAFPLDHLAIGEDPEATALVTRKATLSYKMLNHRVGLLGRWFQNQGLEPGDRIAIWLPKTEIACIAPLAAARAGLIFVPINPALKPGQVQYVVSDSGARLLVTNGPRLKSLDGLLIDNDCAVVDETAVNDALDAIPNAMAPSDQITNLDDLVEILYTSGSTGQPKGVMLSHANLSLGAVSVARYLRLTPHDRTLCVLPLSFDYGQNQLLSTWVAGGCAVPLDYLTPRDVTKACAKEKITTLAAVPPLWVQLVEQEWPEESLKSLKRLTNSGGALTSHLVKQLRQIFKQKTDIYAMYGLTEAFRSTYLEPQLIDDNPTSMGTAIPFAEIMVVDQNGAAAQLHQEGELVHCGPLVAKGYWQDQSRTAERFKPAPNSSKYGGTAVWSGDTVRREANGLLYFVGRDDAMIKSSGNRISPTEIEAVAVGSGLIAEAVALGVADDRLGQAIWLYVRANDVDSEEDELAAELRRYLKQNLPNFMHPQDIITLKAFPKNPNGKLDRNLLMQMDRE